MSTGPYFKPQSLSHGRLLGWCRHHILDHQTQVLSVYGPRVAFGGQGEWGHIQDVEGHTHQLIPTQVPTGIRRKPRQATRKENTVLCHLPLSLSSCMGNIVKVCAVHHWPRFPVASGHTSPGLHDEHFILTHMIIYSA